MINISSTTFQVQRRRFPLKPRSVRTPPAKRVTQPPATPTSKPDARLLSITKLDRWPLGINKTMDEHATKFGLGHWSCVSPTSNGWWVRRDGQQLDSWNQNTATYMQALEDYDKEFPIS